MVLVCIVNESTLWQYLKKGMQGKWHATRIESSSGNGVPDVSFGLPGKNCWIELKYIKEWPKRPSTKVSLPLRPEQKLWIKQRGDMSGSVWVMARIENDFFLLSYRKALAACEGMNRTDWFVLGNCTDAWTGSINFDVLYNWLRYGNSRGETYE